MKIKSLALSLLFLPFGLYAQTSLEEIINDMKLAHEGRPHGVPDTYDWAKKPRRGAESPPETWNSAIAWGQLYEWMGGNPAVNTRVQIRDLEMFLLYKSDHSWRRVQNALLVEGAAYVEDFAGDVNKPADKRTESDGSISVTAGDGYNFHYWPKSGRIVYPKNEVIGCYVTVKARLIMDDPEGVDDRDQARYVMSVGGDWWESLTAVWDNWTTNWDMGIGRFRFVTPEWKSFNMITLPEDSILKYPPPFHPVENTGGTGGEIVPGKSLSVFPNPSVGPAYIRLNLNREEKARISLWTSDGRLEEVICDRFFAAGEQYISWNTSGLGSGLYLVKLEKESGNEWFKCLVIK